MRLNLAAKLTGIVILIIGLTLGLTIMLNYFKFEQTFRNVTESRLRFLAADLRNRIQTGLDLGLDLAMMSNVQTIIDDALAGDPQIISLEVFDERGRILFRTGESRQGDEVPAGWAAAIAPGDVVTWRVDDADAIVVGSRLTSNFGVEAGGVALRYSRAFFDSVTDRMLSVLWRAGVPIFVLAAALAWAATFLLLRDTSATFKHLRDALRRTLDLPQTPPFVPGPRAIERAYAEAEQGVRTVLGELAAAGRRLKSLRRAAETRR